MPAIERHVLGPEVAEKVQSETKGGTIPLMAARGQQVMKKLAAWFLGELPAGYPGHRRTKHQGLSNLRDLLNDEDKREQIGSAHRSRAYPSGLIVRHLRRGIIRLNYLRIQFWVDVARDWMAFKVLRRDYRTLEEIATWRDHYYLFRFAYFIAGLVLLSYLPLPLKISALCLSALLIFDLLVGLAGSALVWGRLSVSNERNFVLTLMNYAQVIVAFASFYRVCGCLTATNPDALQALYFSTVVATTLGFGDIHPLNSSGADPRGCSLSCHLGLFLVMAQLVVFALFVLVFVSIFLSRSSGNGNPRPTSGPDQP